MLGFFRSGLIAAVFIVLSATASMATCLSYADGTFYNGCNYKIIFSFRTDGGCFDNGNGSDVVGPGSRVATSANFSCGGSYPSMIYWSECAYDAWVQGNCRPNP